MALPYEEAPPGVSTRVSSGSTACIARRVLNHPYGRSLRPFSTAEAEGKAPGIEIRSQQRHQVATWSVSSEQTQAQTRDETFAKDSAWPMTANAFPSSDCSWNDRIFAIASSTPSDAPVESRVAVDTAEQSVAKLSVSGKSGKAPERPPPRHEKVGTKGAISASEQ